jgi:KDO2-lipid IV(A) lauroyltransferase
MRKFWPAFINLISHGVNRTPIAIQFFVGDLMGLLWFDVLRIRRQVVLANLRLAFPEKLEKERVRIGRASICHLGRSFMEFLRLPAADLESWRPYFKVEGLDHLLAAQSRGKGVFLLISHVGNGDWATLGFAMHGKKLSNITKEFKWKGLNEFWFGIRQRFGLELIPDRNSSLLILKKLKKNEVIGFTMDQFLGPPIGIKTTFFGHETGSAMGLALLAERAGAAVVPAVTHRLPNGHTVVKFEPEMAIIDTGNKEKNILVNTQSYCDKIEQWVKEYPEQWMWVHRRWKVFRH